MKTSYRPIPFLLLITLTFAYAPPARCAEKNPIQDEADRAYYNLKAKGLVQFSCEVQPDFDAAYKNIPVDAVGRDQVLPIAKKTRFQVVVGPSGAASVSHQSSDAPATEEVATRVRQTIGGMEQIITGFFETWSNQMINPPLGGGIEYQVEQLPEGYRFTADSAGVHITASMNRDFVTDLIEAKGPELDGSVAPRYTRRPDGLLLESYDATYKTGGNSQKLSVNIQYQEIEGLLLPRIVTVSMILPQGSLNAPMTFSDCQVKKDSPKPVAPKTDTN